MIIYDFCITRYAFQAMIDGIANEGKLYSVDEALMIAMREVGSDDSEYITEQYKDKPPAHPVIFGNNGYTLNPNGILPVLQNGNNPAQSKADHPADSVVVGSSIYFGQYEQDNNSGNGPEPIEWIVLDIQDDRALLISKYGLDIQPYKYEDRDGYVY